VKRLDQTRLGMIEPPSRQRRGATGSRAAGHQNRLDDTLRKSGSSLAAVGFFVDERGWGTRCPCQQAENPEREMGIKRARGPGQASGYAN
jgi:hypothetical protein